MEIIKSPIEGLVILKPRIFQDNRGYFFESFNEKFFAEQVAPITFVQDNQSFSHYGVLRGLHFQAGAYAQSKLVRVLQGEVLDVALDLRKDSPTFGKHFSQILSGENKLQMFIPKGFAHGFVVLSEQASFAYKCDEFYHPQSERAIIWNDSSLGIDWQIAEKDIILSEKDAKNPLLSEVKDLFD